MQVLKDWLTPLDIHLFLTQMVAKETQYYLNQLNLAAYMKLEQKNQSSPFGLLLISIQGLLSHKRERLSAIVVTEMLS